MPKRRTPKRLLSLILAIVMLLGMFPATAAADNPAGYVYLTLEKCTIGQGFVLEPIKVPYYPDDPASAHVLDRVLNQLGITYSIGAGGTLDSGFYLTGVRDNGADEADLPPYIQTAIGSDPITSRQTTDWLKGNDYHQSAGWLYMVNNAMPSLGMSDYQPQNNDVIRVQFSVYGYGADIGFDNSAWGGEAALITAANKDELIRAAAEVDKTEFSDNAVLASAYNDAIAVLSDLTASQGAVDTALAALTEPPNVETPLITDLYLGVFAGNLPPVVYDDLGGQFSPDKHEYTVQFANWSGMPQFYFERSNPDVVVQYTSNDWINTSTVSQASNWGLLANRANATPFVKHLLRIKPNAQATDYVEYILNVGIISSIPQGLSYRVNGGEPVQGVMTTDTGSLSATVYLTADVPDDATLDVIPSLQPGMVLPSTDSTTVRLSGGAGTLVLHPRSQYNADFASELTVQFLKSGDANLTALYYSVDGGSAQKLIYFSPEQTDYVVRLPEGTPDNASIALAGDLSHSAAAKSGGETTLSAGAGNAAITVTAADGTQKTYAVSFIRDEKGTDSLGLPAVYFYASTGLGANRNFSGVQKPENQPFSPDQTEYTWDLATTKTLSITNLAVYAVAAASDAQVIVTARGTSSADGTYVDRIQTDEGANGGPTNTEISFGSLDYYSAVTVTVKAPNGAEKSYVFHVRNSALPLSDDTRIFTSRFSYQVGEAGEKIPYTVTYGTYDYTIPLPFGIPDGTVIALNALPVNYGTTFAYTNGSLQNGQAVSTIVATAANGATQKYTFTFVSAAESVKLNSLSYRLGAGGETPVADFDRDKLTYVVVLPEGTPDGETVTVSGTPEDSQAVVTAEPAAIANGKAEVGVTVKSGDLTREYKLYCYVGELVYASNELAGLELIGSGSVGSTLVSDLDEFVPGRTDYTAKIPGSVSNYVDLKATLPPDSTATLAVSYRSTAYPQNQKTPLQSGEAYRLTNFINSQTYNYINVTVTPESGAKKVYRIWLSMGSTPKLSTKTGQYEPGIELANPDGSFTELRRQAFYMVGAVTSLSYYFEDIPFDSTLRISPATGEYQSVPDQESYALQLEEVDGRGKGVLTYNVTAQDGARGTNTITVYAVNEHDKINTLDVIGYSVDDGDVVYLPDFSPDVTAYSIVLPEDTPKDAKITVEGVLTRTGSTVKTSTTLANGVGSVTINGTSFFTQTQKTTSAQARKAYSLNFTTAQPSANSARLHSAVYKINDGANVAIPNFDSKATDYFIRLDDDVPDGAIITVGGDPAYTGAQITGNLSATVQNGMAEIALTVCSADQSTEQTYRFHFVKGIADATDLFLDKLEYNVDGGAKLGIHNVGDLTSLYNLYLPQGTDPNATVELFATPRNPQVAVEGALSAPLVDGKAKLVFYLAAGGGKRAFTVNFQVSGDVLVYDYLPAGSQYTNKSYGLDPWRSVYKKGATKLTAPPTNFGQASTLGNFGGYITYRLSIPLKNDPANPYGVDFIIYGNGQGTVGFSEPGSVQVAQDKDGDGAPDKWYDLAGSLHYDDSTLWDYAITYKKTASGMTEYATSDGKSGLLDAYEYPKNEIYSAFGAYVPPDEITLRGTRLDENRRDPAFGYVDVHPNDAGHIETPLNPYRSGPLWLEAQDTEVRGDGMDIAWAVDSAGNPVQLDEISFVKAVTASFVDGGSLGERSPEIAWMVPLRDNAGQAPVGVTSDLEALVLKGFNDFEETIELEKGVYEYTLTVPQFAGVTINTGEDAAGKNIHINDSRNPAAGYNVKNAKTIAEHQKMLRIIAQEDDQEPVIYYITLKDTAAGPSDLADNITAVEGAKTAIENVTWAVPMATANTEQGVRAWAETRMARLSLGGVLSAFELGDFTPAIAGTETNPSGVSGGFTFVVNLSKGEGDTLASASVPIAGAITATPYSGGTGGAGGITARFRLIGATLSDGDINLGDGDYKGSEYVTWIQTRSYPLSAGSKVYDLFTRALSDAGLESAGAEKNYVKSIFAPSVLGCYKLSEFTNGKYAGWMYTVNASHAGDGLKDRVLKNGDAVIFHYVNDYRYEVADWFDEPNYPALGDGKYYNKWLESADVAPTSGHSGSGGKSQTIEASTPPVTATNGVASVAIDASGVTSIIAAAKKNGDDAIVIAPEITGAARKVSVELPKRSVAAIASETDAALTVKTPVGSVTLPQDVLASIAAQASGSTVTISLESVDDSALNPAQQEAVGQNPVYNLSATSGGVNLNSFDGGNLTISLPYMLKNGETADDVKVWYLNDAGELEQLACTYAAAAGLATFATDHLSYYLVGVEAAGEDAFAISFTDVKAEDWFYASVAYAVQNGLFSGTSETLFSPNASMTRAMLVTVLYRLEGEPSVAGTNRFADVKSGEWYTDAVIWANTNGIVAGYGGGLFGTNDNVTREQLAALLYRYANDKGCDTSARGELSSFKDRGQTSAYALDAIEWAVGSKLISGKGDRVLDPLGTATRAEVAAIMQRFGESHGQISNTLYN